MASFVGLLLPGTTLPAPIPALKRPVVNQYHGVPVTNDYHWLENAADPAVQRWITSQNKVTRTALDRIPSRPWIRSRLEALLSAPTTNYHAPAFRSGRWFILKSSTATPQPVLVTLASITNLASERLIFDPAQVDPRGRVTIDWYVPSHDGSRVAVSLSENGSGFGTLYVYETATGQPMPDRISAVQRPTAGGSAAWNVGDTGLLYTRYPRPGERPETDSGLYQQVYFHKLGAPQDQDTYEIGREFPRIASITLESSADGRRILASVTDGDGGPRAHYLRDPSGTWRPITRFADLISRVEFGRDALYIESGRDEALYLLSFAGAPRGKILRLPFEKTELSQATVMVEEGTKALRDFRPTASGLALVLSEGGPAEFAFYDADTKQLNQVAVNRPGFTATQERTLSSISEPVVAAGNEVLFREESYLRPYAWWRFDPGRLVDRADLIPWTGSSTVEFGDTEVLRQTAVSKDGTRIPLNILRKKGTRLDGTNPTLLTGLGGFGISLEPTYYLPRRLWLDQGGIWVEANLRGGREFGHDWLQAGQGTRKQNVFDDFAACATLLVHSNYTRPAKLAVVGTCDGGLLVSAFLTQQPDLARAVVSYAGLTDMLSAELDPYGAFTVNEYGTVRDPDQFRALFAYSPLHRVRDKTSYPAVLMLAGDSGSRINPAHTRKMVARLQAATNSKLPVLLDSTAASGGGNGSASNPYLEELADSYAFLFEQLGMDYSLVHRGPWSGALTPDSAVVKAKLTEPLLKVRLAVSKNPLLTRAKFSTRLTTDLARDNILAFPVQGLEPDTQYYYALEVNGHLDRTKRGAFRTLPRPGPASFKFAFASCARTGSTSDVFDRIREQQPLFFLHMGDFQYLDIRTNSLERFRAAYNAVLASPQQSDLFRNIPIAYVWDDHDFGGNNANRRSTTHEAARHAYDEFVPHYPLAFDQDGPISQSFTVGRVKFILTDLRSARDAPTNEDDVAKTMMGPGQKAWFKEQLLEANGKYPLICWISPVPWIGVVGANVYRGIPTNQYGYIHHTNLTRRASAERDTASTTTTNTSRGSRTRGGGRGSGEDHWSVYSTERREIADFIKSHHIQGVCILHGDSHMLGADDGSHSDYATDGGAPLPVMCGGPLDQDPSLKGGPYSQGVYRVRRGEGGFGLISVEDRGSSIHVTYSGRNNRNQEQIALVFTVPGTSQAVSRR